MHEFNLEGLTAMGVESLPFTAVARRLAVARLRGRFGVSERRACRVVGLWRSTQRKTKAKSRRGEEERRLVACLLDVVRRHPLYGYRRVWALLVADGRAVNVKRVYRLWRANGLRVPRKSRKKRRPAVPGCEGNDLNDSHTDWTTELGQVTLASRPLLERVDRHRQPGRVLQEGRGFLPPSAPGVGHPHGVLPGLFS